MLPSNFPDYHLFNGAKHHSLSISFKLLMQYYWPEHDAIFPCNYQDYEDLDFLLGKKRKEHIILIVVEEDFYFVYNVSELYQKIKNSKHWSDESFVVTCSRKDYQENHGIINMLYRPSMADLLVYKKYDLDSYQFNTSNIKFHTGLVYNRPIKGREEIAEQLIKYSNQCAMIAFKGERNTFDTINIDERVIWGSTISASVIDITSDWRWSNKCAFSIGYEHYHHGAFLWYEPFKSYAPTLCEKTYKAMHLMRPSLTFGGPGSKKLLNDLGFDTWDWFIDWSYDYEEDFDKGFDLYLKEINRLMTTDIDELKNLLNKNKEALLHNRNQIFVLVNNYLDDNFFPNKY